MKIQMGILDKYIDEHGEFKEGAITKLVASVLTVIIIMVVIGSGVGQVPSGYRGIKLEFGKPVGIIGEGLYFKVPIMNSVELMSVQIQKTESTEMTATADLQDVSTTVALNYHLDPNKVSEIYSTLRHDYAVRVIKPNIEEGLKAATAQFTAEELITRRPDVKRQLDEILHDRLDIFGIVVDAVSLTDLQFSESFDKAIDAKVTVQQSALEAENYLREVEADAQQRIIEANATAEATIATATAQKIADILNAEADAAEVTIAAEAAASAVLVRATAQSEADMKLADAIAYEIDLVNKKIADSPSYIQWSWIQEWDGRLPQTVFGDDNIELLLQGGLTN